MKKRCEGNALVITLMLMMAVMAFSLIAYTVTGTTAKNTDRSRDYAAAQCAAEGAVEYAFGTWVKRTNNQRGMITSDDANNRLAGPVFSGIPYASSSQSGPLRIDALDRYGVVMSGTQKPLGAYSRVPGYPGWYGQTFSYSAQARMQVGSTTGDTVGVRRLFQYTQVPLFQCMFFFEHDLEFYRPATMIISGLIHTNGTAYWACDSPVTIQGFQSYTAGYVEGDAPSAKYWTSGYKGPSWDSSPPTYSISKDSQLHQVTAIEPMGAKPADVFNTTDSNPNNDGFHELIEPPKSTYPDPQEIASRRLYNKAGIVVNISGTTVTVTTQNGTTLTTAGITAIKAAVTKADRAIYDQREAKYVDVATMNVGALNSALSSGATNFNKILYLYDSSPVTGADPEPKTIRLTNGGVLPNGGLTVASVNPIYIQGDYNTGTTATTPSSSIPSNVSNANNTASPTASGYTRQPSSVIGDAVMLLSNAWSDSNSSKDISSRVASNTTYNTAILAGFMPSTSSSYSGGANNFPRFLETWNNKYCTYFGSMAELFPSITFTGKWDTGNIYAPPNRCWNFDPLFLNNPPPGSLDAIILSRGAWTRF